MINIANSFLRPFTRASINPYQLTLVLSGFATAAQSNNKLQPPKRRQQSARLDSILKEYLSERFELNTSDFLKILLRCKDACVQQPFKARMTVKKDNRFRQLLLNIGNSLDSFEIGALLKILWCVAKISGEVSISNRKHTPKGKFDIDEKKELAQKIMKHISDRKLVKTLSLKECSVILWSLAKMGIQNQKQLVLSILDQISQILTNLRPSAPQNQSKDEKNNDEEELSNDRVLSFTNIIWALSELGYSDTQTFDLIIRSNILADNLAQNLPLRYATLLLYSCQQVNYRKKVQTALKNVIRDKLKDLQSQTVLTLKLLVDTISKMDDYDREIVQEATRVLLHKKHTGNLESMSVKFSSMLFWANCRCGVEDYDRILTPLLKNIVDKIQMSNGIDSTMTLYALYKSRLDTKYSQETAIMLQRAQDIHKTLDRRCKDMMQELCEDGSIKHRHLLRLFGPKQSRPTSARSEEPPNKEA